MRGFLVFLLLSVCAVFAACGPNPPSNSGCSPGFADCGGACVSLSFDSRNCGSCGLACAAGWSCVGGVCAPPAGAACGATNPAGACPSGQRCASGACIPDGPAPCSAAAPSGACPSGQSCVGGSCVIPSTPCSPANPAGACDAGQTCVGGACCAEASACGAVCCTAGSVCIRDRSGNRACAPRCDASSECPGSANCCAALTDAAGRDVGYGACRSFVAGETFCRCSSGTECGSTGGCTPMVGADGIPRRPYVCTANGCGPYQHCTGLGSCPNGYCNLCDAQGRCYCAAVCTSAAMCGGATGALCATFARSIGSCSASQTACSPR